MRESYRRPGRLAALAVLWGGCIGPGLAANLLVNPSFESHVAGWPTGYDGWGSVASASAAEAGFAANDGERVLRATDTWSDAYHAGGVYQFFPAEVGATYRLSCSIYHDPAHSFVGSASYLEMKIEFKDGAGSIIATTRMTILDAATAQGQWIDTPVLEAIAPAAAVTAGAVIAFVQGVEVDTAAGYADSVLFEVVSGGDGFAVDIQARLHEFDGFGAQIWGYYSNPTALSQALAELNIKHVRIENHAESATWPQLSATRHLTDAFGVAWVYMIWIAPTQFMDGSGRLRDDMLDAFAQWWADHVRDLYEHAVPVETIELMNEPDSNGVWSTGISATQYNRLVAEVRARLDDYDGSDGGVDLRGVGIVGPGLAGIDGSVGYLDALDSAGVTAMAGGAWSTHAWGSTDSCGPPCIAGHWSNFGPPADAQDPTLPKFVTEYATHETTFHGVSYPPGDSYGTYDPNRVFPYYAATNCMPYAIRVYGNTLGLLNQGANAAFLWQLIDEPTEVFNKHKAWGALDLWGRPKPVYEALKTLYPKIPRGGWVLQPASQDAVVYGGAIIEDAVLVIGLANESDGARDTLVTIGGAHCLDLVEAVAFEWDLIGDPATGTPDVGRTVSKLLAINADHTIDVSMLGDSTLTLVLRVVPSAGDYDGDGQLGVGDAAALGVCMGGPLSAPASGCACADRDADTDVDLADVADLQVSY